MSADLVVITGMSGSGKSIAINALEDAGYYCVDNLPLPLLVPLLRLEDDTRVRKLAVAMDVRSRDYIPQLPQLLSHLQGMGIKARLIFLDTNDGTLIRRFSATRRRHPLSLADEGDAHAALMQAIARERDMLSILREGAHVIDTSFLRPTQLITYVKQLLGANSAQLTLVFESFAFKRGLTLDADYVFDVRMLPNPFYEPSLRALTGLDPAVIDFLEHSSPVDTMINQIAAFLRTWLPELARDHRSYVTVSIGCTGGQHRSVYIVERLAALFSGEWSTLTRHREIDPEARAVSPI